LLQVAQTRGFRVFVLGARIEVLNRALSKLRERYPGLQIDGHHGHFPDKESSRVCHAVRSNRPDILLIAMSSPRKEYWLSDHLGELGVPFAMGIGGAIDVIAGATQRAPRWMQRVGIEWFFRLLQEPQRLAGRYARTNTQFLFLIVREWVRRTYERALRPRADPDAGDDSTASTSDR
jgi:N-acetylglucosaminyldiphosphoundecaprenol N-acetyl-beta-D-mannosaminyltransferase